MNNLTTNDAYMITLKHLINKYGEDKARILMNNNVDNIFTYHGLAYELCKKSLHYFNEICLHGLMFDYEAGQIPLSDTHYEIWDELEDAILNRNNTKNCYVFPRRFGKTSTITVPVTMWAVLCGHIQFALVASAVEDTAANFIDVMKGQLEDNQWIQSIFGNVIDKSLKYNAVEMELNLYPNRAKIKSVSATSSVRGETYRGIRPQLILLDDYQDEKQIMSEKGRADAVKRMNNGIMKTVQGNNNHFIACGTIQFKDDIYDTLLKSPIWQSRVEKCVPIDDIDTYFETNPYWVECGKILKRKDRYSNIDAENYYYDHKEKMDFPLIWENYDRFNEIFGAWLSDPVSFKQELQCDIDNLGVKWIKGDVAQIPTESIESLEFEKCVLSVDPAATTGRKSDYSAFCVLGETDNKIRYARKMIIEKLEFDAMVDKVIELLLQYTDITVLSVEKQVFNGADVARIREKIAEIPELRNRNITIVNKARTQNKDNRIKAIIPDINLHRIIFNSDDTNAIAQIKEFAGEKFTQHDDMIDALADSIENIITAYKPKPKLKVFRLEDFGL